MKYIGTEWEFKAQTGYNIKDTFTFTMEELYFIVKCDGYAQRKLSSLLKDKEKVNKQ